MTGRSNVRGLLGVLLLALFAGLMMRSGNERLRSERTQTRPATVVQTASEEHHVYAGMQGRLYAKGQRHFYLGITRRNLDEILEAMASGGMDAVKRLARQGKVQRVPNNTNVEVLETGLGVAKVRVAERGRIYTGAEGWTPYEFVVPRPVRHNDPTLPKYTVADKVADYIEVILPSVPVTTPRAELERIARAIAEREGVGAVGMFRTEESRQAGTNESYARRHPNAYREGFLGSLRDGKFSR